MVSMVTQHGEATVQCVIGRCIWSNRGRELRHKAEKLPLQEAHKTYKLKVMINDVWAKHCSLYKSNLNLKGLVNFIKSSFPLCGDVAMEILSRVVNKLSRLYWTVQLQKYRNFLFLVKFQLELSSPSTVEISWQLALSSMHCVLNNKQGLIKYNDSKNLQESWAC